MLPPFIIEQIRRREEDQRHRVHDQPQVELPVPSNYPLPAGPERTDDDDRGVVIIDLIGGD